ncbi:DNA recombination protein RmuC [Fluviispira sanaruensis]|uniref:DNA recombination protein RmuC n=1 Tax=Fluviispira sanaruensis TaxID=2493639 RepID=A0A4P2VHM7_FLUSA|nr:DNA recombination protein RmuC [Fluviispira sanaruensis]BBH52426.1 DNA recombination protein RmuC [Fluviispira sanaruensis]
MDLLNTSLLALYAITSLFILIIYNKIKHMTNFDKNIFEKFEYFEDKVEHVLKNEIRINREELSNNIQILRKELIENNALLLNTLTQNNNRGQRDIRETLDTQISNLRHENEAQLDKMRSLVEEKLHATLELRLNASFKQVGDRLDLVHTGIGEMQKMASEVGNLQRVLSNIKTRGILGEEQLDRILSDILSPEQYEKNVKTKKNSAYFIEFAVKLPHNSHDKKALWLPIDAKFPMEDYERILDASEKGDHEKVTHSIKQLETKIKNFAKDIKEKYIDPPSTTDFGILFLPTEGLYSEVLRIAGLSEYLRRELQVVVAGPSTLVALLNSLQMGFRTLAVEKRSDEIRLLLGNVKKDFYKFGDLLEKTQEKLNDASKQIGEASHRSKMISNKLMRVESLPQKEFEYENSEFVNTNGEVNGHKETGQETHSEKRIL